MKTRILIVICAAVLVLPGCATNSDISSSSSGLTTVPPWLLIEIRSNTQRPYRISFTGCDYSRREILSYLRSIASRQPASRAIAIRPTDKTIDFDRGYSKPLLAFARRNRIPITYLDPSGNAIDALLFSSSAYGIPFTTTRPGH